jgi:hypothetical protein
MKVTRAIYVMPNLATTTNSQEMRMLGEQLIPIVSGMGADQVPINQLADFVNATSRFKLRNNLLQSEFNIKLQTIVNEHPETLDKMTFFNLANLLAAYTYSDSTLTKLLDAVVNRYRNLDVSLNPQKTVTLLHDLSRTDRQLSHFTKLAQAMCNYLSEAQIYAQLEPLFHSKLFATLAKLGADTNFRHPLIAKEISHLRRSMNQLQEQSVIFCLEGLNNYARMNRKTLDRVGKEAFLFAKELNALVVEMAVANSDLVDFYFVTRYLTRLAETNNLKSVVSDENREKIFALYADKLKDPSCRT